MTSTAHELNKKTQQAYSWYAKYYAVISLLAYWIVWRGKIFKHIVFFRQILDHGEEILDIATGDGSLTAAALFKGSKKPKKILCLDISPEMLDRAEKKIASKAAKFVVGDVMKLPFADRSQKTIACFGGLNSFPSGGDALKEIQRILHPEGLVRGSVLLFPKANWRQNLIRKWIQQGYQTEIVTEEIFKFWIQQASLTLTKCYRYGDVLLFELRNTK
jgi:ubiquinone/menaquinone biosynthesis C-methylase UbiE